MLLTEDVPVMMQTDCANRSIDTVAKSFLHLTWTFWRASHSVKVDFFICFFDFQVVFSLQLEEHFSVEILFEVECLVKSNPMHSLWHLLDGFDYDLHWRLRQLVNRVLWMCRSVYDFSCCVLKRRWIENMT